MFKLHALAIAATIVCTTGCTNTQSHAPVAIHRLDLALEADTFTADTLLTQAADALFWATGRGQISDSTLARYRSDPFVSTLANGIAQRMPSLDSIQMALGRIDHYLATQLPLAPRWPMIGVVMPYNQSVFFKDSMIFIGLNHYLGSDYPPYEYFPEYIRALKSPGRLPLDVAEAQIMVGYPFEPDTPTPSLLSRMLYEGAVTLAVSRAADLSPCATLALSPEQWKWLTNHQHEIWDKIISSKMLFSTDPRQAASLLALAPATLAISPDAPPRTGRFIGLQILLSYLNHHPDTTISHLLSPQFYCSPTTLQEAQYNP